MKFKSIIIIISLFAGFVFTSCDDSINSVGMGIQPDEDKIGVFSDTVYLDASTIKLDSIYAKTINGYLGEFFDPLYGNIKSGYISQFYAPEQYAFPDTIIDNKIDSVKLLVYYNRTIGDILTPMEVSVFPVVKPLNKHYYTNVDPVDYCDLTTTYGKKGYTARDLNVSDSLYNDPSYYNFGRNVAIRLPNSLGQKFYDEFKKPSPNAYSSLEAFTKFFPGVYLTTTYGSGNMLGVSYTAMYVYFKTTYTKKDVNGNDSTYIGNASTTFNVTKEIIQLNSFRSSHDDQLLQADAEKTYIKTPSGIFTKVIIPIPEIKQKVGSKKFSNAKFSLSAYASQDWKYALTFPNPTDTIDSKTILYTKMLLINPDSVKTFFENRLVADNKTTYTATINSNYIYNFNNISNVIEDAIKNSPDKNLEMLVIPVSVSSQASSTASADYATYHYLAPSGISLKKGKEFLKLEIVTTDADVDQLKR